jgi:hypothetical protein
MKKMKNSIILIGLLLIIVNLITITYGQSYTEDTCGGYFDEGYCYNQFKYLFMDRPLEAAESYPADYIEYINTDPEEIITKNPEAYEKAIAQGAEYINQNKEAFKFYASEKGVDFTSIEGDINNYDPNSKRVETKGPNGEIKVSFTFEQLNLLRGQSCSNFRIDNEGNLVYDHAHTVDLGDVLETQEVKIQGNIESSEDGSILTNGRFCSGDFCIDVTGDNKATILSGCSSWNQDICGFIHIEITEDNPIALPSGTLLRGSVSLRDPSGTEIKLGDNSKYINNKGTTFEVEKSTMVTQNLRECDNDVHKTSGGCIYDKEDLIISINLHNLIKIETEDETYENIVVKEIKFGKREDYRGMIGNFDGKMIFIDKHGRIYDENYNLIEDLPGGKELAEEIYASSQYKRNYPSIYEASVDLTIKKEEQNVRIIFSNTAPLSQGNLDGLQSNVFHIFKDGSDEKFAWGVFDGEPSPETYGNIESNFVNNIIDLLKENRDEETSIYLEALRVENIHSEGELFDKIIQDLEGDVEAQKLILDKFIQLRKRQDGSSYNDAQEFVERLTLSMNSPIFQKTIIDEAEDIDQDAIKHIFELVADLETQKEIISKAEFITDPGKVLMGTDSEELQEMILDKVPSFELVNELCYDTLQESCFRYLVNYIDALEGLNPELREKAIQEIDFNSGIFENRLIKGMSKKLAIYQAKDNPETLKIILEVMEVDEDLDFNPQLFSQVYFDEHFQQATEGLDFANSYSVALTGQRYLERSGKDPTQENVQEVTDLIIAQREEFADHVILDEDTYYIGITHESPHFDNARMIEFVRGAGVTKTADKELKGPEDKNNFLNTVSSSTYLGETTIHLNGHGGPDHFWLSRGEAGEEISDELRRPEAISYVEFGDSLLSRGNLDEVTILIDACFSSDFKNNLYAYLHENGVADTPIIITETNRGSVGLLDTFTEALEVAHEPGTPLTGADLYEIESLTFKKQDLSITIPIEDQSLQEYSDPNAPGVIDIGSIDGEGEAEENSRVTGEPEDFLDTAPMPPTVIEIADNIQELEERFGISLTDETSITT